MTITDQPWRRVVMPGTLTPSWHSTPIKVFVTIEWQHARNDQWELSISAVEGPKANGNAVGGCGQSKDWVTDPTFRPAVNWDLGQVATLARFWRRWHLNGLRAGSPDQEAWLRDHPYDRERDGDHYDWARRTLAEAGLHPDPNFMHPTKTRKVPRIQGDPPEQIDVLVPVPYEYGSAWIYEKVPADVVEWLYRLPAAPVEHPWGDDDRLIEGA